MKSISTSRPRALQPRRLLDPVTCFTFPRYVEGCAYFLSKVGEIMMLNPLEVFNVLDPLSARSLANKKKCLKTELRQKNCGWLTVKKDFSKRGVVLVELFGMPFGSFGYIWTILDPSNLN